MARAEAVAVSAATPASSGDDGAANVATWADVALCLDRRDLQKRSALMKPLWRRRLAR